MNVPSQIEIRDLVLYSRARAFVTASLGELTRRVGTSEGLKGYLDCDSPRTLDHLRG